MIFNHSQIPSNLNSTLQNNFQLYKPSEELSYQMLMFLNQNVKVNLNIKLQCFYNIRQLMPSLQIEELCSNKLELLICKNPSEYGQVELQKLLNEKEILEKINLDLSISNFCDFLRPQPIQIPTCCQYNSLLICHDIAWDYSLVKGCSIKFLIAQAQTLKLSQQEIDLILNSDKISEFNIDQSQFTKLLEINPVFVSELIVKLSSLNINISKYLQFLGNMKVTTQSLEVVNILAKNITLPDQFLNMYITQCIVTCEELKNQKQTLSRYVRLVSVFIKSLIKSKTFNPTTLFVEIQGFCIEFSMIQETNSLFKIVKKAGEEQ